MTANDSQDGPDPLLSLEELAAISGVAPRTIRYYQTKKLLQRPTKDRDDGRVSRYGPEHCERLRLIGELHDKGLKLPAIKNLLDSGDATTRVADWLGLKGSLGGSWNSDAARIINQNELDAMLESTPPGTLGNVEEARLIERQGDAWLSANPALLELTLGLIKDGIAPDLVLEAGAILQAQLSKAAEKLIQLFVKARDDGFGTGTDTGTLVHSLRPIAGDAARMIFGQELENSIEALLADTKRLAKNQP